MDHRVPACSIQDIAYRWSDGFGEKEKFALLHAFFYGDLKAFDPLFDAWHLCTDGAPEQFIKENPSYGRHYILSGEEVLMTEARYVAVMEYLSYGRPVTVTSGDLSDALQNICIRKNDFRAWLEKTGQALPKFWFSDEERGIVALPKDSRQQADNESLSLGDTERASLQKQIGALALVLAEKSAKYKNGDKPNASQIAEVVSITLDAMPDVNKRGVSSANLRASIKAGIGLLQGKRRADE